MHTPTRRPQRVSPSPEVLRAIRTDISQRNLTVNDRRLSSVAFALAAEPIGVAGLNEGLFYPPMALPPSAALLAPSIAARSRPTTGKLACLVLLVDFSDNPGKRPATEFQDRLFSQGTYPTRSLRDYYKENSCGQLEVDGQVVGWLRMPKTYAYYVGKKTGMGGYPRNAQKMVEDALQAAVKQGVNFAHFDSDGDGYLDGLFIVHAGGGAEADPNPTTRAKKIWSHQWNLSKPFVSGGVTAYAYCTEPEDGRVGVFCHEFGHMLGLPDLYDTTYKSEGVGVWCVMGAGSWNNGGDTPGHFCAWAKARLGWIAPNNITGPQALNIAPNENCPGAVHRLWTGGASGSEYFLIENRQKIGFDAYLPLDGLLIWHIDDTQHNNDHPASYWVGLEQADGRFDLEMARNNGDTGDPYPGSAGNTRFDAASHPPSTDQLGKPTSVSITNIAVAGGNITCDVAI